MKRAMKELTEEVYVEMYFYVNVCEVLREM